MANEDNVTFSNTALIAAFKNCPILWDSHLEYKDVKKKQATWVVLSWKFGVVAGTYALYLSSVYKTGSYSIYCHSQRGVNWVGPPLSTILTRRKPIQQLTEHESNEPYSISSSLPPLLWLATHYLLFSVFFRIWQLLMQLPLQSPMPYKLLLRHHYAWRYKLLFSIYNVTDKHC